MKTRNGSVVAGLLMAGAVFCLKAQAQSPLIYNIPVNDLGGGFTDDPGLYWDSPDISVPNLQLGAPGNPLLINLDLSQNLILNNASGSEVFGWGISGLSYSPNPNEDIANFNYQLVENGTPVGPQFGLDLPNPFNFPVDNVATASSAYGLPVNLEFNEIDLQISSSSDMAGTFTDFAVTLAAVPDASSSLMLLSGACLALGALRRKFF